MREGGEGRTERGEDGGGKDGGREGRRYGGTEGRTGGELCWHCIHCCYMCRLYYDIDKRCGGIYIEHGGICIHCHVTCLDNDVTADKNNLLLYIMCRQRCDAS